jgi:hydrogenase/urease accessory protein HupE
MIRFVLVLTMVVTAGLAPGRAWAHAGSGAEATLASALAHPLTGIHILAAIGVGLYAAWLGGRAARDHGISSGEAEDVRPEGYLGS